MSKPISEKKNVKVLLDVCQAEGLTNVVISPGSRNAPLIISFASTEGFRCYPVVDERSAAYFALGMAQQTQKPVALVCTSGTAVLNYAPAIAEAYYQHVPLVVITADRPKEWVNQADGQTIDQSGVFRNFIRYSCDLPAELHTPDDEWYASRQVAEAFVACRRGLPGPVHINVPLREPLYGRTVHQGKKSISIKHYSGETRLSENTLHELSERWNSTDRILILCGMMNPNPKLYEVLNRLSAKENVAVLTETLSNCHGNGFVRCIDRVVNSIREEELPLFRPDLLVTLDGPVLSKMIKSLIRQYPPKEHWHLSKGGEVVDTYRQLTRVVEGDAADVLVQLETLVSDKKARYRDTWLKRAEKVVPLHLDYLKNIPWCDLKAFDTIFAHLPKPLKLQLGNSTPVRYAQLFDCFDGVQSYGNRGTSGIDGSVSTAVGAALASNEPTLLIVGDLSFFYDSNALWNRFVSSRLKIVVVNNGGGVFSVSCPDRRMPRNLRSFLPPATL
ncbi:MAG: 2-succinyl-5-enolpyruvyl-6-hydroxy-3-cyclohexene-1-carboxylic-acid synthase [Breznakibacter sp.]